MYSNNDSLDHVIRMTLIDMFCKKFEGKIEIIGSIHVRCNSKRVLTCLLDESVERYGNCTSDIVLPSNKNAPNSSGYCLDRKLFSQIKSSNLNVSPTNFSKGTNVDVNMRGNLKRNLTYLFESSSNGHVQESFHHNNSKLIRNFDFETDVQLNRETSENNNENALSIDIKPAISDSNYVYSNNEDDAVKKNNLKDIYGSKSPTWSLASTFQNRRESNTEISGYTNQIELQSLPNWKKSTLVKMMLYPGPIIIRRCCCRRFGVKADDFDELAKMLDINNLGSLKFKHFEKVSPKAFPENGVLGVSKDAYHRSFLTVDNMWLEMTSNYVTRFLINVNEYIESIRDVFDLRQAFANLQHNKVSLRAARNKRVKVQREKRKTEPLSPLIKNKCNALTPKVEFVNSLQEDTKMNEKEIVPPVRALEYYACSLSERFQQDNILS